ncbi:conserved hypothetical protein [Ricinus communis]|uniref:Uncharacterized protein n=1 Tax=Ricinus communis TaxID=3988 RepID=B9T142_RICCO|nr:conserved hypothetical protein [Ricinus communis]
MTTFLNMQFLDLNLALGDRREWNDDDRALSWISWFGASGVFLSLEWSEVRYLRGGSIERDSLIVVYPIALITVVDNGLCAIFMEDDTLRDKHNMEGSTDMSLRVGEWALPFLILKKAAPIEGVPPLDLQSLEELRLTMTILLKLAITNLGESLPTGCTWEELAQEIHKGSKSKELLNF